MGTPDEVADFSATLNPYKFFCDDITEPDAPLSSVSVSSRCVFRTGQENLRHYTVELGSSGLQFNYAIDACWTFPTGSPPWDVPDDFSPSANRPEAWNAFINETGNTLWNDGTSSGGSLILYVEIWDHYFPELNILYVESPGNFSPIGPIDPVVISPASAGFDVAISSATPAPDSIDILIMAQCEKTGYQGLLPDEPITAYFIYTTEVGTGLPPQGIYVDDSNDTGIEDGTQEHPFNTIGEGLEAASNGDTVNVDDSGNLYEEQVTLKPGVVLKSLNWDITDGGDRATISFSNGPTVKGEDDATIEGFLITGDPIGIECVGTSPHIADCHVAHIGKVNARGISVHSGAQPTFEDVKVYDIHDKTDFGYATFSGVLFKDCIYTDQYVVSGLEVYYVRTDSKSNYCHPTGIRIEGCDNMRFSHNIVHDITTYNPDLGGSYSFPTGIKVEGSDHIQIRNNIIYNIDGGNYKECFGIRFINCNNCKCGNNVVYDVRKNYYYGTAYGISGEGCFDLCQKNNIVMKIKRSGGFQSAYGVRLSDTDPYCFEYQDVWDCSSGYYTGFMPGVGCINADPMFVDQDGDPPDFHLLTGSPCIDAGDPKPEFNDPDGSRCDIGAYGGPYGDW
jgi:hypothetical protein